MDRLGVLDVGAMVHPVTSMLVDRQSVRYK